MSQRNSIGDVVLEDIDFTYPEHGTVLKNIDLKIPSGKSIWVKGHGGSGKSTLLKIICGLREPTDGRIYFNGCNICELSFEEFLPYRLNIGYSFDYGGLINNKSLWDNLRLPLDYHRLKKNNEIKQRLIEIFEYFEISDVSGKRPAMVIGGVRKLLCLLRAFVHEPSLILLDDPTTGLNKQMRKKFFEWVSQYRKDFPSSKFLITSEDEEFVKLLCDTYAEIDKGRIVDSGKIQMEHVA